MQALERGSDSSSDAADSAVESEEPSADARSTGRGRKRKADADVEDDYDPLEDHSDAQNADSSASEAEASDESGDVRDSSERPRARRSMAGRQKQRDSTGRQSRASRRAELPMPVHTVPDVSGSEEDDYELQQALAMSMLDSQLSSDPRAAQQQPVAAPAASAKASVTAQQGYTSQQKPSVKKEAIALDQEPEALTLDVEDIKSAEGEASRDRASLPGSSGAAPLQKPAGKVTAAGKSRAAASDSQANKKGKAAAGIEESGGPKGRKRPAKGKAIEIYDPAEINKAFDLISDGSSSIREHMLQKVGHHRTLLHLLTGQTAWRCWRCQLKLSRQRLSRAASRRDRNFPIFCSVFRRTTLRDQ